MNGTMRRLHPAVFLLLLLGLTVTVFFIESAEVLGLMLLLICLLHVHHGHLRRPGLLLALGFAGLPWMFLLFWWAGVEQTGSWSTAISWALRNMAVLVLRLATLMAANLYVVRRVSFRGLTHALYALKVPESAVLFVSTLVRFLPVCGDEARRILEVQRCREFDPRRLLYDPRAMAPIFVPLFVAQMKRSHDVAMALELRRHDVRSVENVPAGALGLRDYVVGISGLLLFTLLARYT